MKVALAQFIYESNTFNPEATEMACFTRQGTWLTEPEAIREWARSTESQMQSSLQVLEESGVETMPILVAVCGSPGGRLSAACHREITAALLSGLSAAGPVDAMLLHLHGAVAAEGVDDVEGELLAAIRQKLRFSGPIVVSLDLHANVTPMMLAHANAVTAYRTAPHEDFGPTGERAARMLLALPDETQRVMAKVAVLIPPTATNHRTGPFAAMLTQARALEDTPGILDISMFPVQPWFDVEGLSSSVVVTSTDREAGTRVARELAETWYAQRFAWPSGLRDWQEIKTTLATPVDRPWLLVDTADATTGGSEGASAEAIAQLWPIRDRLSGPVLLWVVDPAAVAEGAAGRSEFEIGATKERVNGEITFAGECRFRLRGRAYRGQEVSCGQAVVLAAGQLRIVVTEQGCLCSDPAFFEAVGLDPTTALAVHVKSLLGWEPGYEVELEQGLYFDGPGYTSLDFERLSFTGARRQLYPISESPPHPVSLWQST